MRKKVLLYGLCAALLLSLTACRKSQVESQPAEPDPPEVGTTAPEPPTEPEPPGTTVPEPDADPAAPAENKDPQNEAEPATQEQAETAAPETAEPEQVSEPVKTEQPQQTEPKKTDTPPATQPQPETPAAPTEPEPPTPAETTEPEQQQTPQGESDLGLAGWTQSPNGTWRIGGSSDTATQSVPNQTVKTPTANSERPLTPEERAAATDAAAAQAKIAQETGNQYAGLKFDEEGDFYYYEY